MTNIHEIILTQEYLKSIFLYSNGRFYWIIKKKGVKIGDMAGSFFQKHNRYRLTIDQRSYVGARVVFFFHKGYWPECVDHENHIVTDDRIENLRDADDSKNNQNCTSHKDSASKYLGVSKNKANKFRKWCAHVTVNKKQTYIGGFITERDAALAYNREAVRNYGEFANLNIITFA